MKFENKQKVHDYLKNSKIDAGDKSKEVQKVLYEYGFKWLGFKNLLDVPTYFFALSFLFINGDYIYSFDSEYGFHKDNYKQLPVDDILSIEIEEEVVQPHVFKPFDKVLMCKNDSCWNPEFFKSYGYGGCDNRRNNVIYYMSISGYTYTHCIPYEGNENLIFKPYSRKDER